MKRNTTIPTVLAVAAMLMLTSCQAPLPDIVEKPFKKLCDYRLKDFHLSSSVTYFTLYSSYSGVRCRYDPEIYRSLEEKLKDTIVQVSQKDQNGMWLYVPPVGCVLGPRPAEWIVYLDDRNRAHKVTNTREFRQLLGNIDTPAELQLWLRLNGKIDVCSYRRTIGGYTARFCKGVKLPQGDSYDVKSDGAISEIK